MTTPKKPSDPSYDYVDELNGLRAGFNRAMNLLFKSATTEKIVAEIRVDDQHLQPYGLVHGGVYAGMIETACSSGAALNALARGQSTVGLENSTSFLRAVRGGTLTVTAVPLARGRRSQVWEARVTDDKGRLAASGRVRLLCLDAGEEAGGKTVALSGEALSGIDPSPRR